MAKIQLFLQKKYVRDAKTNKMAGEIRKKPYCSNLLKYILYLCTQKERSFQ